MNSTENKYITDLVKNDYLDWKLGENIILNSGTNTGKTTFIFVLAKHCIETKKRILYLVSRKQKIEEMINEVHTRSIEEGIEYSKVITIASYQRIEACVGSSSKKQIFYKAHDYIYADECHYFIDDSAMFSNTSEQSMKWIIRNKTAVKIFASATADDFYEKLKIAYNIPANRIYRLQKSYDYVDKLYIYKKEQTIALINNILNTEPDSKILVFVGSADRMIEFNSIFGNDIADYLCSSSTKNYQLKGICNLTSNDVINSIPKRILFSTKTLDVGVNIIDEDLKHIICQLFDAHSIIQCFGRKRPQNSDDICTFYLEHKTLKNLVPKRNAINSHLQLYEEYKKNKKGFEKKYKHNRKLNKGGSIFEFTIGNKLFVNKVRLMNYKMFMDFYSDVSEQGFIQAISDRIDKELADKIEIYESNTEQSDKFLNQLKEFEGIPLYKEERSKLQEIFIERMSELHAKTKTQGIAVLNSFLNDNYKYTYKLRLFSHKDKRRILPDGSLNKNRDKVYWTLE